MDPIHAQRAIALVGTRFRAQGRNVATGLDCVGLALAAFELPVEQARADYRLRGNHRAEIVEALGAGFRPIGRKQARAGDLMLLAVAEDQLHLAVRTAHGFVHADAGLRRVVETPGEPHWPMIGVYRRRVRK